ncbi:T9SS type A sorting domain-containing protein [Carboxylicivirga sp. M1479]|uniref:T9SS type A sorting domain-containing protein n=1 Tax=Carboxylicivirga sp. M1479 TaxID=2594476 RepID=UPI0011788DDA|nr:T9SS type A sorting domain-containing protein [Carboxylicivirga sp. M1479]TRX70387.1 T9SS type A sorting domain-containing protein [Carboxylicivirga sp. M1479]
MKKIYFLITLLNIIGLYNDVHSQNLVVYNNIPDRAESDQYLCRIKFESEDDSAFRNAFVLQTRCKTDAGYYDNLYGWSASWIAFESDFNGDNVVVEISKKDGSAITKAMVRPMADASSATIANGKAYVTLSEPANINVDINGQMEDQYTGMEYNGDAVHTISVFANPIYQVPNTTDPGVIELNPGDAIPSDRNTWHTIYFKPGVHDIGLAFEILSNETLFIPGNAVVHGTVHPPNLWGSSSAQNFTVYGSGAISGENYTWTGDGSKVNKTFTYQAANARLEGFVVIDPANHTFNMNSSFDDPQRLNIYKNLKILAWRQNSDAINAFRNSVITDCFFRVQDDVFYYGENVKISNITTWNDANGAVLFLTKGSTVMEDSYFKDITSIYHRSKWHYWDGGRIISMRETSPGRTIKNVFIQNVLVEDPYPAFPPFYATMIDGTGDITLNNIVIENVHQANDGVATNHDQNRGKPQNTMLGLDYNRQWENITFKNCYFNGKTLTSFDDGNFKTTFVDYNTVIFQVPPYPDVENIINVISPNQVSPGETVTVSVDYNATETRDIRVFIQLDSDPWATYGSNTITVAEGTGSANIDLPVSSDIPIANDAYKIVVNLLPIGGSWSDRIDENIKANVNAVEQATWNNEQAIAPNVLKIYPNPVKDMLNIIFPDQTFRNIKVYNLAGQLLYNKQTNGHITQIDINSLNVRAPVVIQVKSEKSISNHKILVD